MLWDTCLEVWIEINHPAPIEIAWWVQQHMCCYRKLWVSVLYMGTVTFSISYVLLSINTKIHSILLKLQSGVIYIFFQCGTSIFKGKTCTVITPKLELWSSSNTAQGVFEVSASIVWAGQEEVLPLWGVLHPGQPGTSTVGPSWSTSVLRGALWGRPLAAEREW